MIAEAKEWLRFNGDYNITISLHDVYGMFSVKGIYLETIIANSRGMNLDKHINKVLEDLKIHKTTK